MGPPIRLWAPAAACFCCAATVGADVIDRLPPIDLVMELAGCPIDIDAWTCGDLVPLADGTFRFTGEHRVEGVGEVRWSLRYHPDPFVVANLVVTNNTDSAQDYSITVNLPTTMPGPTLIGGFIVGQFCDGLGDGAILSVPPTGAIYEAQVDGLAVAGGGLLEGPLTILGGPYECIAVGPAEFGSPVPSAPSGPVALSIGLSVQFTLSARDTATFMSQFVVEPAAAAAGGGDGPTSAPINASNRKEMP